MKVVIVGATSGIGRALASVFSENGHEVGITGRRRELLDSLKAELPTRCYTAQFDLSSVEDSIVAFNTLAAEMGAIDIVIINSGVGTTNIEFPLQDDLDTISVNVTGFTTIANMAYHYFCQLGKGHIVGMSSVAAVRGGPFASYNASKAFVSSYLEGLACRRESRQGDIFITDIRPGFVDTAMAKGDDLFWVASPTKAAHQIYLGIVRKQRIVYITRRWRWLAYLIKALPFSLYRFLVGRGAEKQ
ncbi:SDR family NAD(P)-dependent oxidoreductase [Arenicella sp. 4NH20-0111]|uniref:SDR family NAD(P)-dependent oxidoreductase n=1 Tax=Arenicella sp. 4NH20-0111 TaxID=3127648 RepID=UPI003107266E